MCIDNESIGCDFTGEGGVNIWFMDEIALIRACELMQQYEDHPMDFADASVIVALEQLQATKVFTLDHNDFATYYLKKGHHNCNVELII